MELQITGHHISITPGLEKRIRHQVAKIVRYSTHIHSLQVILSRSNTSDSNTKGKQNHQAEFILRVPNNEIFAKATADDMYSSINQVSKKLSKQMRKYKTKIKSRRPR